MNNDDPYNFTAALKRDMGNARALAPSPAPPPQEPLRPRGSTAVTVLHCCAGQPVSSLVLKVAVAGGLTARG